MASIYLFKQNIVVDFSCFTLSINYLPIIHDCRKSNLTRFWVRFSVATVCGVEWNVYAAAFTPQNGAIVRTDSVRTKAYLQNSETCMRNLHW